MSKIQMGDWSTSPRETIRPGVERILLGSDTDLLNCSVVCLQNGHRVYPHSHPSEQISLILEGECDFYVDGKPYRMKAGNWIFVPSGLEHYIHVFDSPVPCVKVDMISPSEHICSPVYQGFPRLEEPKAAPEKKKSGAAKQEAEK